MSSAPTPIKTLEEFIRWVKKDVNGQDTMYCEDTLYRGLAFHEHYPAASLHLRMAKKDPEPIITQRQFVRASQELVDDVKTEGHLREIGEQATDLEILAQLQHYGAATCFIDFTQNPLVALWFACQKLDKYKNGKVFAVNTSNTGSYRVVKPDDASKKIEELMGEENLWRWQPKKQNNRIIAQQSVFIFGTKEMTVDDVTNFLVIGNKEKILADLEAQGISEKSLFCDFDGFARVINGQKSRYHKRMPKDYFDLGVRHYNLGEFKMAINKLNEAIITIEEASKSERDEIIAYDKWYADAYFYRGNANTQLGEHPNAITDYTQAIKINPQHAEAYYNRGNANSFLGDHPAAIADYTESIKILEKA